MDQLLKIGRSMFNRGGGGGGGDSDGGLGLGDALGMLGQIDQNGDNKITEEDFVLMIRKFNLGPMGDQAAKMAFAQVDTNKNGKLDMSEAVRAFEVLRRLMSQAQAFSGGRAGVA